MLPVTPKFERVSEVYMKILLGFCLIYEEPTSIADRLSKSHRGAGLNSIVHGWDHGRIQLVRKRQEGHKNQRSVPENQKYAYCFYNNQRVISI